MYTQAAHLLVPASAPVPAPCTSPHAPPQHKRTRTQGREAHSVLLLVEGEVEVVVDVPYTDDEAVLSSALRAKMRDPDRASLALNAGADKASAPAK